MKDLTFYLISHLVDYPDKVEVTETTSDMGTVNLNVKVAKEDMGKIIGKQGKTIRAIRDVVKILALKQNKYVDVTLTE